MRLLAVLCVLALGAPARAQSAAGPGTDLVVTDNMRVRTGRAPTVSFRDFQSSGAIYNWWDVFGDNGGFFVIDALHSTMPFWIQPDTPPNSFVISRAGNVGLGTDLPTAALHVRRTNGSAQFLIEEAVAIRSQRTIMNLHGFGGARVLFLNTAPGTPSWSFGTQDRGTTKDFLITSSGPTAFTLSPVGDLTLAGTLTQLSDRNAKTAVEPVDAAALLERAAALPVSSWRYRSAEGRHVGPMAQDFAAAFGLGADDTHVAPSDVAGVMLAAAQALAERSRDLTGAAARLERRLAERDQEVAELEAELRAAEAALDEQP